ncbi:MAG TPA: hypothetical protein ENK39_06575 [Epsilonproteobacteria bacterium]|nr:hypothetical protein [Campylobacterota bacterium]
MYDIKPLEEEWKQYQKKKRKPYLLASIGGVLLAILGFTFFNYKYFSFSNSVVSGIENTIKIDKTKENNILIESALSKIQVKKIDKIEEIKPIVKMNMDIGQGSTLPTLPLVDNIPILEDNTVKNRPIHSKRKVKKIIVEKPRKKMHLNIIESSSLSAYKDVERRFMQSHDTDDSLFLAKSYYRKGNYKKSEFWSLQTNKVNSHIEESWMIFAQSKIKLGHINEAIQVLKGYVKRTNSEKAKALLYRLKKN